MLETRAVTVFFGSRLVLSDCSIAVEAEEIVALVGPSGSGKSTLLRVIAGILTPLSGDIVVDGTVITGVATHRRDIGFVFQDEQLFPHRTVSENVGFGLRMKGWKLPRRRQRVGELLELVGLAGFEDRSVTQLSGGEAKRVALARTLAPAPKIVLLDEPLTGLDSELHDQLAVDLAHVLRATQTTALLVTHDRREAEVIADRTVAIDSIQSKVEL